MSAILPASNLILLISVYCAFAKLIQGAADGVDGFQATLLVAFTGGFLLGVKVG